MSFTTKLLGEKAALLHSDTYSWPQLSQLFEILDVELMLFIPFEETHMCQPPKISCETIAYIKMEQVKRKKSTRALGPKLKKKHNHYP